VRIGERESASKLVLVGVALAALFLVIGSSDWGASGGFAPTERSNAAYTDFARDLFDNHGFELVIAALIIAAAALGGLQIAREEEFD
jgi:NADH:ubiquinone oxidoreductase subunit 6 (subunit J)